MMWFAIFAGIAAFWLILTISYGIWLWHKASDLFFELKRIGHQVEEIGALVTTMGTQVGEPVE